MAFGPSALNQIATRVGDHVFGVFDAFTEAVRGTARDHVALQEIEGVFFERDDVLFERLGVNDWGATGVLKVSWRLRLPSVCAKSRMSFAAESSCERCVRRSCSPKRVLGASVLEVTVQCSASGL